jgi:cysteine desulfurase/selenocysteine lyase
MLSVRAEFPLFESLDGQAPLVYLDSAATTQKPQRVLDSLLRFLKLQNANVHRGVYGLAEEADALYEGARAEVARFLGADSPRSVIFTHGATESLNMVAQGWARHELVPGSLLVVSALEHHSNFLPWQQLAMEQGLEAVVLPVDRFGAIDHEAYLAVLEHRPALVALSGMSNVTGAVLPYERYARLAHDAGAVFVLDVAQMVAHRPLDVQAGDIDFLAFSAHKVYGPTGVGVLYVRPDRLEQMCPVLLGGGMVNKVWETGFMVRQAPWGLEAGTPPIAEVIAMADALRWLEEMGFERLMTHEDELYRQLVQGLRRIPNLRLLGFPEDTDQKTAATGKSSLVSFAVDGLHPHDVASLLDQRGIAVRAGHHCAILLHAAFLSETGAPASVRASIAAYTSPEDITAFLDALADIDVLRRSVGR